MDLINRIDFLKLVRNANFEWDININIIIRNYLYLDKYSIEFAKYRLLYYSKLNCSILNLKNIEIFIPCNTDIYAGNTDTIYKRIIYNYPKDQEFQSLFCVNCGNYIHYYVIYIDNHKNNVPLRIRCMCDI